MATITNKAKLEDALTKALDIAQDCIKLASDDEMNSEQDIYSQISATIENLEEFE